MAPAVEVLGSIAEADPAEWDRVVEASSAPIFYSYDFLNAYEKNPLQNFERVIYFVAKDQGNVVGLIPAYLQTKPDALGTLSKIGAKPPVLLTHVLHCYDTQIVAPGLDPQIVETMSSAMGEQARSMGAEWVVFANVDATAPLVGMLETLGFQKTPMEERFNLNLKEAGTFEALTSGMIRKHRRELVRQGNRADDAGATIGISSPPIGDLDDVIELLRLSAGKFEAASYYPPEHFAKFLERLGDSATLFRVQGDGRLLAAGACLEDRSRFHMWAAGVRYDLTRYSPYYLLFREVLKGAFASGKPIAEGGRGNAPFKQRYGMKPVPLVACIARA